MAQALPYAHILEFVHLGMNRLGDEGAASIATAMLNPGCAVKEMHLTRCGIGPAGQSALS